MKPHWNLLKKMVPARSWADHPKNNESSAGLQQAQSQTAFSDARSVLFITFR